MIALLLAKMLKQFIKVLSVVFVAESSVLQA